MNTENETIQTVTETVQTKKYPEIKDRTGTSILIMFLFGILPGLIALIYTNKATNLYSQVKASDIESVKDALYEKAIRKDKTSKAWIIIGFSLPLACFLIAIIASLFD